MHLLAGHGCLVVMLLFLCVILVVWLAAIEAFAPLAGLGVLLAVLLLFMRLIRRQ